ncbi:Asp-tRNA(Asn)/Glu-tRNA(Gln) amidotransferase subunit GatB [Tuwongella immobilis]|uniref:Aspartyl/glutamyl-tRNA(Asn/Gln) amidotransferase subunit B n=1 Tax=Tuwongella immobilis TaxID=692036 RepID=A0A6C2YU93_9BACT|nr:Asp-tRNA(Asn)/Glu-tRNA(Gln) amidotransferase subunit GatB [Tuwongella immobilis]VIP04485.1 aspartyl glutamyl-trna amidotransferase subunit b : Aspartyl/glutamyl-tRNA(Asn/Gln) amidotransferase subunit B OS=Blastopirellula marina DSM 3645 GN=gatB PE=3 SV=1: GatB_N: GatB_Yqey [Tuwongella immobilis]VTS06332.1 aspartyl glutamyl-trna amidotransferase subunit b : Aspartyl/glutamyl-tRNA(Asn/Gln) amidotransferase subunit B OS=Blastopirellula marina DSM 3645 GN=gatB PE=3 SV=1: GatB_N: GatB_Yqey [Tuwonge
MADPYRILVGLEVHVQLLTKTKLFCGCSTLFGLPPNSATCPVCLGMPGSLPVMNRKAFKLAMRGAIALNCEIAHFTKWDRKNYYYPDLPKNYQISQYDLPFSSEGYLEIRTENGPKKVGIIRAHLEEDAGKSMHDESGRGGDTKVDLNRTGTPLIEIVSKPEINTPEEARAYLEELRLMLRELGVSDCEMQQGSLRCDANVNVLIPQPDGSTIATGIVEVKNLNSIRSVERAIRYEAKRQYDEYAETNDRFVPGQKETRGWDDALGRTWVQRRKEDAADYRYFPEPDLVPVIVTPQMIEAERAEMGELPSEQRVRLQQPPYGLSEYDADVIASQGRKTVAYFESVAKLSGDPKVASNWITNDVLASLKDLKVEIDEFPISAERMGGLVAELVKTGLNKQRAREVYAEMLASQEEAAAIIAKLGFKTVADEGQLREIIRAAIAKNPKAVADFKGGKVKAADAIKGAVMKETKGMAKMEMVQQLLLQELENA